MFFWKKNKEKWTKKSSIIPIYNAGLLRAIENSWQYNPNLEGVVNKKTWEGIQTIEVLAVVSVDDLKVADLFRLTNLKVLLIRDSSFSEGESFLGIEALEKLEELRIVNCGVTDDFGLDNLVKLPNLRVLYMSNNALVCVDPIVNIGTLSGLDLSHNPIKAFPSDMYKLSLLTKLALTNLRLENADFLSGLKNLEILMIENNQLSDISFLEGLPNLLYLKADNNKICDIRPIASLAYIQQIFLDNNNIEDITALENLNNITRISLSKNRITTLEPLKNLQKVKVLRAGKNQIESLEPIRDYKQLVHLIMGENKITSMEPIANIESLGELNLSNNNFSGKQLLGYTVMLHGKPMATSYQTPVDMAQNFKHLKSLKALWSLSLCGCHFSDISVLSELVHLRYLHLENNNITNIEPLSNMTQLENLQLCSNNISDISPLEQLTSLSSLNIAENRLTNIQPLANMTLLKNLSLYKNKITDISRLTMLTPGFTSCLTGRRTERKLLGQDNSESDCKRPPLCFHNRHSPN